MIANAPGWLQPLLWIACMALAAGAIVLLWTRLSAPVERLHVESMDAPPRSWKHAALAYALLLLVVVVVLCLLMLA
jgi:hypothetical protein